MTHIEAGNVIEPAASQPWEAPDIELLSHEIAQAVKRYITAAEKDPEGAAREWSNLADVYADLGKFLIRTRTRRVA